MPKYYAGIAAGDTLNSMQQYGGDYGISPSQDLDCNDVNASGSLVGVGATFSGKLNCSGTTYPFYPPRVTNSERDNMDSPAAGAMIWNTSSATMQFYNGSAWRSMDSSAV